MRLGKVVIPARLDSERLPKKMMINILGRPMIEHVWRRACHAVDAKNVVVVTDSVVIASHMSSVGADVYMSEFQHYTGTSRVSEYIQKTSLEFALILQGDEVLVRPSLIKDIFQEMSHGSADFINAVSPLESIEDLYKMDVVKCWVDSENYVRFIFRGNPLRDPSKGYGHFKVINGLFAISRKAFVFKEGESVGLDRTESIEQLGLLDQGIKILSFEMRNYFPSVNTQNELEVACRLLETNDEQKEILSALFNLSGPEIRFYLIL